MQPVSFRRFGLTLVLLLSSLGVLAQSEFKVFPRIDFDPEYHLRTTNYFVAFDQFEFDFSPPSKWSMTTESASRNLTLRAPDGKTAIALDFKLRNPIPGRINTPPTPNFDDLKSTALAKFPGATVLREYPWVARGMNGQIVDVSTRQGGSSKGLEARYLLLFSAHGTIEVTMTTSRTLQENHGDFGAVINSLNLRHIPPPPPKQPPTQ